MLRGDGCVAAYVHGPQGQVLGAFRLKTIQKINCKEINVKIKRESRSGGGKLLCRTVATLEQTFRNVTPPLANRRAVFQAPDDTV
jgi:predicted transcriptional regulator